MLEKLAVRNKRHDYYVKVSQHGVGILVNAISCKLSGREISSPLNIKTVPQEKSMDVFNSTQACKRKGSVKEEGF